MNANVKPGQIRNKQAKLRLFDFSGRFQIGESTFSDIDMNLSLWGQGWIKGEIKYKNNQMSLPQRLAIEDEVSYVKDVDKECLYIFARHNVEDYNTPVVAEKDLYVNSYLYNKEFEKGWQTTYYSGLLNEEVNVKGELVIHLIRAFMRDKHIAIKCYDYKTGGYVDYEKF